MTADQAFLWGLFVGIAISLLVGLALLWLDKQ